MKLNFYIIYSTDIPINLDYFYDESDNLTTKKLVEALKFNNIKLLFEELTEEESMDLFNEEGYENWEDFYDDYCSEYREEMIELLVNLPRPGLVKQELRSNIPYYIRSNPELFIETESDDNSDKYDYCNLKTIHRKYCAQLNNEQFIDFINIYFGYSTCNTMGSLTELGWLPAFSIEIDSDTIDSCYVSVLFNEELSEERMEEIEKEIRALIESEDLTLDYLNNL